LSPQPNLREGERFFVLTTIVSSPETQGISVVGAGFARPVNNSHDRAVFARPVNNSHDRAMFARPINNFHDGAVFARPIINFRNADFFLCPAILNSKFIKE
jgi:hypothetical protein